MSLKPSIAKLISFAALTIGLSFSTSVLAQNADNVATMKSGAACGADSWGDGKCDVSGADLSGVEFIGSYAHLTAIGTNFSNSSFSNSVIDNANLTNANFSDISMFGGSISKANLTGANFTNASLSEVEFGSNNLKNANFEGANIQYLDNFLAYNTFCNTTVPDGSVSDRDC